MNTICALSLPSTSSVALGMQRIAAKQAMSPEPKDRPCGSPARRRSSSGSSSSWSMPWSSEQRVDLADLKAALVRSICGSTQESRRTPGQSFAVPGGILGEAVERQPQRPHLGLGQVGQTDRRHLDQPKLPGGQDQTPARYDPSCASIKMGRTKPYWLRLVASLRICPAGCFRVPAERLATRQGDQAGIQIARDRKAVRVQFDKFAHVRPPAEARVKLGSVERTRLSGFTRLDSPSPAHADANRLLRRLITTSAIALLIDCAGSAGSQKPKEFHHKMPRRRMRLAVVVGLFSGRMGEATTEVLVHFSQPRDRLG